MVRNELLDAAIEECRKAGVTYRFKQNARTQHIMFFVGNSPRVVVVGASHRTRDVRAALNVRCDIRKSIALLKAA